MAAKKASITPPGEYPALLDHAAAAEFLRAIGSAEVTQRAARAVDVRRGELGSVVKSYVAALSSAVQQSDCKKVFALAHEIRGLAGTAGLEAAGRIADGLCRYIDAAQRCGATIENSILAIHIEAISSAAAGSSDAAALGTRVANELDALVSRKLGGKTGKPA